MPTEVILAVRDKSIDDLEKITEVPVLRNKNNTDILDNIVVSYQNAKNKKDNYIKKIKILRAEADQLKEEIYLKKNIKNDREEDNTDLEKEKQFKKKIEINNYSINEETCNTVIDHLNNIRSNISTNSKVAHETLIPLEASFELLKTQVKYTILLEDILELFNKQNKLEEKLSESDQIIAMLAESLGVK